MQNMDELNNHFRAWLCRALTVELIKRRYFRARSINRTQTEYLLEEIIRSTRSWSIHGVGIFAFLRASEELVKYGGDLSFTRMRIALCHQYLKSHAFRG